MKGWRVPRRSSTHGVKDRNIIERDEDLMLFRELHQRDKERILSLLLPVSDEFEPNVPEGKQGELYRIPSAKKGSSGFEFLAENDKHDTDWLKTPPATPLFPSLEMEATGPRFVNINNKKNIPNPIPALHQPPLSRFAAANPEVPSKPKNVIGAPKSPNFQQPKKSPLRSISPSQTQRPTTTRPSTTQTKKPTRSTPPDHQNINNNTKKSISNNTEKERQMEFLASNLSKNATTAVVDIINPKTNKPRSRAVSPLVRSTISAQIPEFSNATPPNLITDDQRSISATRGRPAEPARRQSCSPSVTRGRKVVEAIGSKQEGINQKDRIQVLGSKMVEKVMHARKSNINSAPTHESPKDRRPKSRGSMSEASGPRTGRMISSNAKPNPPTLWSHSRR